MSFLLILLIWNLPPSIIFSAFVKLSSAVLLLYHEIFIGAPVLFQVILFTSHSSLAVSFSPKSMSLNGVINNTGASKY